MQEILSLTRRAVDEYGMIEDGDRIAVGVSGGKDSILLLCALKSLSRFYPKKFTPIGVTLDLKFAGKPTDYSNIQKLCEKLDIEYYVKETDIAQIIFDVRKESNPCSLCARMRRGALHDIAKELNCNKLALGHHADDAVETFMMNLIYEGRIGCFSPVTYLSRKDITVIRPFCLLPEVKITSACKRLDIPVLKSACPADGGTTRESTKQLLNSLNRDYHGIKNRILGALQKSHIDRW